MAYKYGMTICHGPRPFFTDALVSGFRCLELKPDTRNLGRKMRNKIDYAEESTLKNASSNSGLSW